MANPFGGLGSMPGIGTPTTGASELMQALGTGLSTDRILEEQQKRALLKQQIQQSALTYLQQLRSQMAQNPSSSRDPSMVKNVQESYSQAGMGKAPMTPATPATPPTTTPGPQGAAPGGFGGMDTAQTGPDVTTPGKPAQAAGIDPLKLGGVFPTFQEYVTKYSQDILATPQAQNGQPSQRQMLAEQIVGRPLTPTEVSALESQPYIPPKSVQQGITDFNKDIVKEQENVMKSNNPTALLQFVQFNWQKFRQYGYSDDQIQALIQPGLDQMSPEQIAKIRKDASTADKNDEATAMMKKLADLKYDELQTKIAGEKQSAALRAAQTDRIVKELPDQLAGMRAKTKEVLSQIDKNEAQAAEQRARADFIGSQSDSTKPGSIAAQNLYTKGMTNTRSIIDNINNSINSLSGHIATLQGGMASISGGAAQARAQQTINDLNQQLNALQQEKTQYTDLQNSLFMKAFPGVLAPGSNKPTGAGTSWGAGQQGSAPGAAAAGQAAPPKNAQYGHYNGQYGWIDPANPSVFHAL